jgi:hypothetical protein
MHPKIFFYCCPEQENLQEDIISLAEGLSALGIQFYSNAAYWRQSLEPDDYLFKYTPDVTHHDCDIVVVTYTWPLWVRVYDFARREQPLPPDLFKTNRKYITVFMDNFDGHRTISWDINYRSFDVILRSKYNRRCSYPANIKPWAYGLTNRILEESFGARANKEPNNEILVNHGASHSLRYNTRRLTKIVEEAALGTRVRINSTRDDLSMQPAGEYQRMLWRQTGRRHIPNYYMRLRESLATVCFCGDLIPSQPQDPSSYLVGGKKAHLKRFLWTSVDLLLGLVPRLVGSDSFRYWEAFACQSAAINLDLEHYGVQMPVMPINMKHYVGLNKSSMKSDLYELFSEPSILENIAASGHEWALEHYSPIAVAKRFLQILGYAYV